MVINRKIGKREYETYYLSKTYGSPVKTCGLGIDFLHWGILLTHWRSGWQNSWEFHPHGHTLRQQYHWMPCCQIRPLSSTMSANFPHLALLCISVRVSIPCHLFAAVFPAHFLQSLQAELLLMEAIKRNHGIRKTWFHNAAHAFWEVKSNLHHALSLRFIYFLECLNHILGLCAFDDGNYTTLAPMCILVGYDGIDLSCGQACFVNAYMRTNVFRKDEPFVCMVQFLPSAESADMVLVGTAEFVAI